MMTEYITGKINVAQLFSYCSSLCKEVATINEIQNTLNNSFTMSILCDQYNVDLKTLTKKLNKILDRLT